MLRLADHAIRLARLDAIYRAGVYDRAFENTEELDAIEVVRLIEAVPFERLTNVDRVLLNPDFALYSEMVGGADADIIVGDRLIDIKVTKTACVERDMVRQLVAYLILARCAQRDDASFPTINSVGIYFARQAHLWEISTCDIVRSPEYVGAERLLLGLGRTTAS